MSECNHRQFDFGQDLKCISCLEKKIADLEKGIVRIINGGLNYDSIAVICNDLLKD